MSAALTNIDITETEFNQISELVYKQSGINLTEQKKTLIIGRLYKSLKVAGFNKFSDYYEYVINDSSGKALSNLINCISTNHTFFYREEQHFDFFSKICLPEIIKNIKINGPNDLRIWCAGCSSGEEAYMIAMLLMEYFGNEYGLWNAGLLATDISGKVLDIAQNGIYHEKGLEKLPLSYQKKYFIPLENQKVRVIDKLKREATFRRFNLMNEEFPFKKQFHIIFCRNVMIYFDKTTREQLIKKFHKFLVPNGYFFTGLSESLGREQHLFKYIQPAIFKRI